MTPRGQSAERRASGPALPCLTSLDRGRIRAHLERDEFFWLDLTAPDEGQIAQLGELFGFHPLALEDTTNFHQRPKLDHYGDYVLLVFYGAGEKLADDGTALREVHIFISGSYVVTVHREPLPALERTRLQLTAHDPPSEQFVLYQLVDGMTDTFFPLLAEIDDEIDQLEEAIVASPDDEQLARVFALRRNLIALRKVVTPQRDLFARSIDAIAELPGLTLDERDYFRDVYDHLIRISDLIDSYRDLLSGATDLYVSTLGNRQNEVMKQLAIVGTVFLPLSFITGFFGMNFGWLVSNGIHATWTFWVIGVGSMLLTVAGLLAFFRRKRWL